MAAVDRNVKLVDYREDILIDTILQDYSVWVSIPINSKQCFSISFLAQRSVHS